MKPYTYGIPQALGSASGGILEDDIGTADGRSRGLRVPEATTNKMTNPVFGHATWDNGWTADSSLVVTENTNERFLLPGTDSSARITSLNTGQRFTQSINVGNTNTHTLTGYVRLPDAADPNPGVAGGRMPSDYVELYYGAVKGTTFTAVGNGWYRMSASFAGIASATDVGVEVKFGKTAFVTGFQLEEKASATPLCWGNLLGCSWSGTAHASTSTRTVARWRIPSGQVLKAGEGSIRLVLRMSQSNTRSSDVYYFADTSGLYVLFFSASGDTFTFFAGITYAVTTAQTFSAGQIVTIHLTYGNDIASGIVVYIDGEEAGNNSLVDADAPGTYLYLGSDQSVANHGNDVILDFTTWDAQLTAAQVANDYANLSEYVMGGDGSGYSISPIPWLWTKDGDDTVDNCDDSSRDNYAVIGGIPGTRPARTLFYGSYNGNEYCRTWLSLITMDRFYNPAGLLF
ncbi:MAG: LamG domain-containing protein [Anaerolineae bacterium]|nr:LamG domain-containing protein [Anaerolineae bacterium]